MIYAPTNRRVIRPYDKPSFEHTQRYGLIKGHPLGPAGGLVAHFLFNEGSGNIINDLSRNGNTGTLTSGITWVSGKDGPALDIPPTNSYVDVGNNPVLDFVDTDFTIIADIYPHQINGIRTIIGNDHNTVDGGWDFWLYNSSNLGMYIANDYVISDAGVIAANNWQQVAFVWHYLTKSVDFYVKGVYVGTDSTSKVITSSGNNCVMGIDPSDLTSNDFDGLFSCIFAYALALTSSEIALVNREPFCMIEREISPAYFFIAAGEGEVYQELNLTVSADASASESDSQQMVDTGKAVSADASVSKIDTQQMVETGRAVEAAASISCTDLKVVFELNLEVTASGSAVATDAHTMIETGKSVTAIATPAVIDTQTMVEIDLDVSAEGSVSCTDTMGLLAHIAAFMILRQCTT